MLNGLPVKRVLRQYTYLIGVCNGWYETKVCSDAGKRVVLVSQCLIKGVTDLTQIVGYRHIVDVQANGKRIDKHSYRIGNPQVGSSAADRTEIDFTVIRIA